MFFDDKYILTTERLVLLPYKAVDREYLYSVNDSTDYLHSPCNLLFGSKTYAWAVFRQHKNKPLKLARAIDHPIGVVALYWDDRPTISWWIAPKHRGNKYCTEAAKMLVKVARLLGASSLQANIYTNNEPSIRIAHKLGMKAVKSEVYVPVDGEIQVYRLWFRKKRRKLVS